MIDTASVFILAMTNVLIQIHQFACTTSHNPYLLKFILNILNVFSSLYLSVRKAERGDMQMIEKEEEEESHREILLRNVSPDLACEIRQCWIDPDCVATGSLLGRGGLITEANSEEHMLKG